MKLPTAERELITHYNWPTEDAPIVRNQLRSASRGGGSPALIEYARITEYLEDDGSFSESYRIEVQGRRLRADGQPDERAPRPECVLSFDFELELYDAHVAARQAI